jgi:peptide deformylase
MAVLEVLKFPDPRLREVSKPVTKFDEHTKSRLAKLADDMFETMYSENGVGLAAAQVNELIQMLIIDARPRDKEGRYKIDDLSELEKSVTQPLVILNPVITHHEGKTTFDEGCLSVPNFYETVQRYKYIELEYHDLVGKKCHIKTDGFLAIVIQHEMDHLEGTLFIDHLSLIKSNKIKNQIKKHGYPPKKNQDDGEEDAEL